VINEKVVRTTLFKAKIQKTLFFDDYNFNFKTQTEQMTQKY